MNRSVKLILAIIAAGGLGLLVMAVQFNRFLHSPLEIAESGVNFEIKSGSSFRVTTLLQQVLSNSPHGCAGMRGYRAKRARFTPVNT